MSDPIRTVFENAPHAFQDPILAGAAGAVAIAGYLGHRIARHLEDRGQAADQPPLADSESAELVEADVRTTRRRIKLGYGAAVGLATMAMLQIAGPLNRSPEGSAQAAFDIAAGNSDSQGLMPDGGTQLEDSIDGSLSAAEHSSKPVNIYLDASEDVQVASLPAVKTAANIDHALSRISGEANPLNSNFLSGDNIADGVDSAINAGGSNPNDVIILASSLNPNDASDLAEYRYDAPKTTKISAVLVGQATSLSATELEYQGILGTSNVEIASSASDVESEVKALLKSGSTITDPEHTVNSPKYAAYLLTGTLGLAAFRRRFSGVFKFNKNKDSEGDN